MTGLTKIDHVSTKLLIISSLLYHNLLFTATNLLPLLQNFLDFLQQFTETRYYIQNQRY